MLILYAILTCLMIVVILSDITHYIIPNWLVLALIVTYPAAVWISPEKPDWKTACVVSLITFVVGILLLMRIMGGGDIKLLTATALYVGKPMILDFLVYVALIGGVGTLVMLGLRVITPYLFLKLGQSGTKIPRVLTDKEPVPYGVAIAAAFLYLLWDNKLPGLIL